MRPGLSRRRLLKVAAAMPFAALAVPAETRDYASAAEVLAAIDRLEADLDRRMVALSAAVPAAAELARSVRADHERHRGARATLRRRLRLEAPVVAGATAGTITLAALTALAQDLVHAYAEGLPAIRDDAAVSVLALDMVDDARHLAVLQMWAEAEEPGA